MALVGKYETYEQLGKGSTGTVYRARDAILGREVALKILNAESRISSHLLELFSASNGFGSELLHPNIAIIYDLGRSTVGPFVATELLTGATFRSHIRDRCALSLVQKLDFIIQACEGLAHAHKVGLIHAALNPGSFWVDDRQHVRILDLGIRHAGNRMVAGGADNSGVMDYLAPEQITEDKCDIRSDLFSAAAVFYEFLANVHPFQDVFIPRRIAEGEPDRLFNSDPYLPKSLERLLFQTLSKNPDERPQSAMELGASFHAIEAEVRSSLAPKEEERKLAGDRSSQARASHLEGHSRIRLFLELLRRFDQNLASASWIEAQQSLVEMKALSSGPDDDQFVEAIMDSEERLARARDPRSRLPGLAMADVPKNANLPRRRDLGSNLRKSVAASVATLSDLSSFRSQVVATIVVASLILGSALFISRMRQESSRALPALAQARVNSYGATLLQSPESNGRTLTRLKAGTWVILLDHLPARRGDFVRIRSLSGRLGFGEGYLRTTDLKDWKSDNPDVNWKLLVINKPSPNAPADEIEQYIGSLNTFTERFPMSQYAQTAEVERRRWVEALSSNAEGRLAMSGSPAPVVPDGAYVASPDPEPLPAPLDLPASEKEKVQHLLDRIPALWNEGNLEEVISVTAQAISLDPGNQSAMAWRAKARKALRKLNDQ